MAGGSLPPPRRSTSVETHLPEIRVVVLGDGVVGKTSFLRQYLDHEGPSSSAGYEPTLLDSYTHIEYCGKQPYQVHLTDCSSAPEFREHRAAYLTRCDMVVLIFSALHRKTLSSLREWMKEVVDARSSTGPARFASTVGDFSEVPIFVVGTHYGEKQASAAQKLVSFSEAESVTVECLHSAGYFVNEEDAGIEGEMRTQRAVLRKNRKAPPKRKQSPHAFHSFFADLFKGGVTDPDDVDSDHFGKSGKSKSYGKKETKGSNSNNKKDHGETINDCLHYSQHSRSTSQFHAPFASSAVKPSGVTVPFSNGRPSSEDDSLLTLPLGASPRLPLYMLSNKDGEAVTTAMRASLALYLWLKQMDNSIEVSPGVTPLTTPRARSSALLISEQLATSGGDSGSAPSAEPAGLSPPPPSNGRDISAASHNSHMSERSTASFMPSMHALYGSVTSPSAFDTHYHSRATSSGPLTDGNSPLAAGQLTHVLVAIGDSALVDASSPPGLYGKTSTEPHPSSSVIAGPCDKSPLSGSPWFSPTVSSAGQVEVLRASTSVSAASVRANRTTSANGGSVATDDVTPGSTVQCVSSEHSPVELDATANDVTPLQEEQYLVQANAAIFINSPPNPRRATAPNTAIKPESDEQHLADLSVSTSRDEFSAPSGRVGGDAAHPPPACATTDTLAPSRILSKGDDATATRAGVWRDVDAEGYYSGDHGRPAADSVVKRLALEHDCKSCSASNATSPQKLPPPAMSASGSPSCQSPRASAPISIGSSRSKRCDSNIHPASAGSSDSILRSPTVSPRSQELTHTDHCSNFNTHSHRPTPRPKVASRSRTRPPQRENDDLAKSTSLSQSGSHLESLTRRNIRQKQKVSQCTSGGCDVM